MTDKNVALRQDSRTVACAYASSWAGRADGCPSNAAREQRGSNTPSGVAGRLNGSTEDLLFEPLLPDVGVGALDPRSASVPLAKTLRLTRLVRGHATAVALDAETVTYTDGKGVVGRLAYDRLLLASGSVTRLLDIPGLAEHAIGLKTASEALYLREHTLHQLDSAGIVDDETRGRAALTFVMVGAGYAGVELAAQMACLTRSLLPLHPAVGADDVHSLLIDIARAVMPELDASLGDSAQELLRRRGVDVRLGVSLEEVTDAQARVTDGTVLDCHTVVVPRPTNSTRAQPRYLRHGRHSCEWSGMPAGPASQRDSADVQPHRRRRAVRSAERAPARCCRVVAGRVARWSSPCSPPAWTPLSIRVLTTVGRWSAEVRQGSCHDRPILLPSKTNEDILARHRAVQHPAPYVEGRGNG